MCDINESVLLKYRGVSTFTKRPLNPTKSALLTLSSLTLKILYYAKIESNNVIRHISFLKIPSKKTYIQSTENIYIYIYIYLFCYRPNSTISEHFELEPWRTPSEHPDGADPSHCITIRCAAAQRSVRKAQKRFVVRTPRRYSSGANNQKMFFGVNIFRYVDIV